MPLHPLDDGPEPLGHLRIARRDRALERERAGRGGHPVGGVDVVLDEDRDAEQRPAVAGAASGVGPARVRESRGADRDHRVELRLQRPDPVQVSSGWSAPPGRHPPVRRAGRPSTRESPASTSTDSRSPKLRALMNRHRLSSVTLMTFWQRSCGREDEGTTNQGPSWASHREPPPRSRVDRARLAGGSVLWNARCQLGEDAEVRRPGR